MIDEPKAPTYQDATGVPKPSWESTEVSVPSQNAATSTPPPSSSPAPVNPFEPVEEVAVTMEKKGPSIFQVVAVIVLLIVVLVVGAIILVKKNILPGGPKSNPQTQTGVLPNTLSVSLTPTMTPTQTPIPTPTVPSDELIDIEQDLNSIDVKTLQ